MKPALVVDLQRLLPKDAVSVDSQDLERHSVDALGRYRAFWISDALDAMPQVVVRPKSVEQVAAVAAYASQHAVPLVPWGGGTGVMGGAIPQRGGIVLDLKGLDQVHQIDVEARTVAVGAGVVLEDLGRAMETHGLALGHDPWSLPIATVGGAISTNGVGYLAGKYGPMGDQVLGLEVVLPSGQFLQPRRVPKSAGPALDTLFIGAEGTLGIITQAVLVAHPAPEVRSLHAYRFSGFEAGFHTVQEMHALGLRPALVDFDEEFSLEGGTDSRGETTLYLGFEGYREEVEAQMARGLALCRHHGGEDLGGEEAQHFWDTRHESGERYKREVLQNPGGARRRRSSWRMDYLHVAIPASRVLEYRRQCQELLKEHRIPVREWSLWGRPEFFSLLIADPGPTTDTTSERMAQAVDQILIAAQDIGGAMEYCHGVGLKLAHLMDREHGPGMEALRGVKKALDPAGILNPGKLGLG